MTLPRMPRRRLVLLSIMAAPVAAYGQAARDAAYAFVVNRQLGKSLRSMALTVVPSTQTYAMIVAELGAEEAKLRVSREVDGLLPKYQDRWNGLLAAAYANHYTVEELRSLTADGPNSKYVGKLTSTQDAVGQDMQKTAMPLLIELATESLSNVFFKIPRKRAAQ